MTALLTSLIIIACVLLIIIILIQNPKGGGLSSSFGGGGTQLFGGVKKTTDFLDRGTWVLSIILVALVLFMNVMISPRSAQSINSDESEITEEINEMPAVPVSTPQPPAGDLPEPVEEGNE